MPKKLGSEAHDIGIDLHKIVKRIEELHTRCKEDSLGDSSDDILKQLKKVSRSIKKGVMIMSIDVHPTLNELDK